MRTFAWVSACLAMTGLGGCLTPTGTTERPPLELTEADRTPDPACTGQWVAGVRGLLVDEAGVPIPNGQVQMCTRQADGALLCLDPTQTDANGWYTIIIPEFGRCLSRLAIRGVRTDVPSSTAFCRVPLNPARGVLDVQESLPVHRLERPVELPPRGDTSAMRTVRFASGLELDIVPDRLDFIDSYEFLAAGQIARAEAPCFVDDGPADLDALWAIGPELASLPGVGARVPAGGLAEGTAVELYLVGGIYTELASGDLVEEGAFERFGTGRVQDGMIVVDAGSEIPYLSWLGIRSIR